MVIIDMSHSLDPATRFHRSRAQRHTRTRKCGATLNSTMSLLSVQPIEAASIVPRLLDTQQRVYYRIWSFRKSQQLAKNPANGTKKLSVPRLPRYPNAGCGLGNLNVFIKTPKGKDDNNESGNDLATPSSHLKCQFWRHWCPEEHRHPQSVNPTNEGSQ